VVRDEHGGVIWDAAAAAAAAGRVAAAAEVATGD
jgi:hypothetical protein